MHVINWDYPGCRRRSKDFAPASVLSLLLVLPVLPRNSLVDYSVDGDGDGDGDDDVASLATMIPTG